MTKFSVPEMSCGHCKASIEKAVALVDASASVFVDLATREVTVESQAETKALIAAMKSEGYEAIPLA
jgi:copper chaperone